MSGIEAAVEAGPNAEQASYWGEASGQKWVALQERIDAQISPLGLAAIDVAAPQPGESVLDVGCGCGQTSLQLAERVSPGGHVLGLDLSAPMLARAAERAKEAGLPASFERGDAQIHPLEPASFDLAFSRFGVMFFADPVAAFTNLRGALAPGRGRLVFACWQPLADNEWVTVPLRAAAEHITLTPPADPLAPGPFSLADADHIREILAAAGFERIEVESQKRPVDVGGGATPAEVIDFVLQIGPTARALAEADAATTERVRDAVRVALEPHFQDGLLRLGTATWIVSARPGS
jgi:SAM-dependent methyltransferase